MSSNVERPVTPDLDTPASEVVDGLNELLRLDHDAVGSYDIAIERLENSAHALQIRGFRRDHERHIRRLNKLILAEGGVPVNEPHATAPLKEAMQRFGGIGGDHGLLLAWRTNELQSMVKYDRYAQKASNWPRAIKRSIDEHALDEERHYSWVVGILGVDDPAEVDIANRVRERTSAARKRGGHKIYRPILKAVEAGSRAATTVSDRGDLGAQLKTEISGHLGRSVLFAVTIGFLIGRSLR